MFVILTTVAGIFNSYLWPNSLPFFICLFLFEKFPLVNSDGFAKLFSMADAEKKISKK